MAARAREKSLRLCTQSAWPRERKCTTWLLMDTLIYRSRPPPRPCAGAAAIPTCAAMKKLIGTIDTAAAALAEASQYDFKVVLGPAVYQDTQGPIDKQHYCIAITGSHKSSPEIFGVFMDDPADKAELVKQIVRLKRDVNDFEDELEAVKCAEAIWPSAKISGIRRQMERGLN